MRSAPIVALAAVAALALVACAPPAATTTTTTAPPPSPTTGTTTTTTTTTTTPAPPDCHTQGVVPGALNCLVTDQPIVGNPGQDQLVYDATNCSATEGRWVDASGSYRFSLDGQSGGNVLRIDIWNAALRTPAGIGLGTPLADLLAAYPGITTGTAGFDTAVYWISDAHGYVVFETGAWDPATFAAAPEQVVYMRILDSTVNPDFTVSASENIAGVCPLGDF